MKKLVAIFLLLAVVVILGVLYTIYYNRIIRYSLRLNQLELEKKALEEEISRLEFEKEQLLNLSRLKLYAEKKFEPIKPEEVLVLIKRNGKWVLVRRNLEKKQSE